MSVRRLAEMITFNSLNVNRFIDTQNFSRHRGMSFNEWLHGKFKECFEKGFRFMLLGCARFTNIQQLSGVFFYAV
jgi:hypothetical protein